MSDKASLSKALAQETGLTQDQALQATNTLLKLMSQTLIQNERLELRNFGIFEIKHQKPRKLKHPKTGQPITVPSQKIVRFKAAKNLKKSLNGHQN